MTSAIMHTDTAAGNDAAVLSAIQHERLRVARDIHDVVLQDLTAVLLQLRAASRSDCQDGVFSHLGQATSAAEQGLAAARNFLHELRREMPLPLSLPLPLAADLVFLAPVLREAAGRSSFAGAADILCEFCETVELPRATCNEVALILREALANALKHAGARQVLCQLVQERGSIELRVSDDGCGFLPGGCGDDARAARGAGVNGMASGEQEIGGLAPDMRTRGGPELSGLASDGRTRGGPELGELGPAGQAQEGLAFDGLALRGPARDSLELRGPVSGGLGLSGMAERAALVGGTLAIHSAPGSGSMVRLRLRLPARP